MENNMEKYEIEHIRRVRELSSECTLFLKRNGDFPLEITVSKFLNHNLKIKDKIFKYFLIPQALISTSIISSMSSVKPFIPFALGSRQRVIFESGKHFLKPWIQGKNKISSPIPP